MGTFKADENILRRNTDQAAQYSDQLKAWIDEYDNPAYYEDFTRATGFIGAPCAAALREHGRQLRENTTALAARYAAVAEASTASLADLTGADEAGAASITNTTREI
jgi:hypothetical protein